jgi:hypothetical protein
MHGKIGLTLFVCFLFPWVPHELSAAPAPLYGKSIMVSWAENRVEQKVGENQITHPVRGYDLSIYVSSAGRISSRLTAEKIGGRNSLGRSGRTSDKGDGNEAGQRRTITFEGNTLVMLGDVAGGTGARRVIVDFDGSYGRCTAQVVTAKPSGASKMVNEAKGREVYSAKAGAATCSVKNGNVLGGE